MLAVGFRVARKNRRRSCPILPKIIGFLLPDASNPPISSFSETVSTLLTGPAEPAALFLPFWLPKDNLTISLLTVAGQFSLTLLSPMRASVALQSALIRLDASFPDSRNMSSARVLDRELFAPSIWMVGKLTERTSSKVRLRDRGGYVSGGVRLWRRSGGGGVEVRGGVKKTSCRFSAIIVGRLGVGRRPNVLGESSRNGCVSCGEAAAWIILSGESEDTTNGERAGVLGPLSSGTGLGNVSVCRERAG